MGFALGEDQSIDAALASISGVAEGVPTAPAMVQLAESLGVSLPICHSVARLVSGEASVAHEMVALLSRPMRDE